VARERRTSRERLVSTEWRASSDWRGYVSWTLSWMGDRAEMSCYVSGVPHTVVESRTYKRSSIRIETLARDTEWLVLAEQTPVI
jgi:hypothetical protein